MRERAQKRDWDEDACAVYWCVDYERLLQLLQLHMWGVPKLDLLPPAEEQRTALSLMTAGWALAGCDFVRVPGLNAAMVFDALPGYIKTAAPLVALMAKTWSGERRCVAQVRPALRRLVMLCASNYEDKPRARKASVAGMRDHSDDQLLRAAWTAAYWNQREIQGDLSEFGFAACLSSGLGKRSDRAAAQAKPAAAEAKPGGVVSRFFAHEARSVDRVEGPVDLGALAWGGAQAR